VVQHQMEFDMHLTLHVETCCAHVPSTAAPPARLQTGCHVGGRCHHHHVCHVADVCCLPADMELVTPEERLAPLQGPDPQPVLGYSRFYSAAGTFTWAPCSVLEYDRWVSLRGRSTA
jgi:hypothetical protein